MHKKVAVVAPHCVNVAHALCSFISADWMVPGVLFGLKVLSNHYHPGGVTYIVGFPVSNRYASWLELVLIHITSPG